MRTVKCIKLGEELEGLKRAPYPGPFGWTIFENVSQSAWDQWLNHQTMLINENRLNMLDPEARKFLMKECDKYFFGEGSKPPLGYTAPFA